MDSELPHSEFFPDLRKFAVELIKSGVAYVDFSTDAEIDAQRARGQVSPYRDNNPIIDVMLFQTYCLTRVGTGTVGCLRLKLSDDPVIYRRINDAIYPTYTLYKPIMDYSCHCKTLPETTDMYVYNYIKDKYAGSVA